jgi:hypothetical protein
VLCVSGLLFLHIPKTAGTSLKRYLSHQVAAADCLLDPPSGASFEPGVLDRLRFVAGHLDYDFAARYLQRPFILTCLRHPVERALSAFYYQRTPRLAIQIRMAVPQLGATEAEQILADLQRLTRHTQLRDFLQAEPDLARKTLGNLQTEYLAGATACAAHGADPDVLSTIAFRHLEACEGILLADRLPETLRLVDPAWVQDGRGALARDNAVDGRPAIADHAPDEIAALTELLAPDLALYRHAERLIEERRSTVRPPALASAPLANAADFRFDQPIHGTGWHVREAAEGTWFCWTDRDASLTLRLESTGDHRLECMVEHASCAEAWAGLAVTVNGQPVTLSEKPAAPPGRISAQVDGAWLDRSPDHVAIGFRVPKTIRPSDADPGNPDTRRLGIALSRVRLIPQSAQ